MRPWRCSPSAASSAAIRFGAGAGAAPLWGVRLLGARGRHDVRLRIHGRFTPRFGVDGLTAFFLGMLGLVAAPTLAFASRYSRRRRGAAGSPPSSPARSCSTLAEVLCARDPLTFLAGWELMTLLPAALILVGALRRGRRRTVFLYIAVTHIGRRGHLGRRPARRALRASSTARTVSRAARAADRDRADGARRHGDEGRRDAVAQLAAACASDRARAGVGADERRDDQGRGLRPRARARRLARRAAALVRRARARARRALGGRRRRLRALPARPQAAARVPLDRERRDHRARARRVPAPARPRRRHVGGARAGGRAAAHAQPRRLQVAALPRRGRVRAGGRLARARPARRAAAAHAVDGRRVPRRLARDRRACRR